jgi:hypothetical protein
MDVKLLFPNLVDKLESSEEAPMVQEHQGALLFDEDEIVEDVDIEK